MRKNAGIIHHRVGIGRMLVLQLCPPLDDVLNELFEIVRVHIYFLL